MVSSATHQVPKTLRGIIFTFFAIPAIHSLLFCVAQIIHETIVQ